MSDPQPRTLMVNLAAHGWTTADITGLLRDWPTLTDAALVRVGGEASRLDLALELTPAQTRAWLRALYTSTATRPFERSRTTNAWIAAHNAGGTCIDIVTAYRQAADGDDDLACIAFAAGLSTTELINHRRTGPTDLPALRALASLINH